MRAQIHLILALLAAPLLVSATEVEEYFPITVGASWTYSYRESGQRPSLRELLRNGLRDGLWSES